MSSASFLSIASLAWAKSLMNPSPLVEGSKAVFAAVERESASSTGTPSSPVMIFTSLLTSERVFSTTVWPFLGTTSFCACSGVSTFAYLAMSVACFLISSSQFM